ncbi:MAG: immunoglobulin domain-containing protein, partial [Verrucomicrobiota bacterium]
MFASITLSGSAHADCLPNPSGLIGWWPGDGNANNLLGTNNGTLQGGATASAAGLVGNNFTFDGTNNYVQIPNSPILQPTNLTIEAWIKFSGLDSAGTGPAAGVQNIIFKQNTQSSSFEGFDLGKTRVSGSDYFRFIVSSGSGQSATIRSSTTISTGVWYHVAAVRGPNFTQLYINGILERQTNVAFAQNYGTQPLYFGTTGQSYWDRRFKGNLDEVSLYNRALGSNEITAIFIAGAAGKCKAPNITSQPQHATVILGGSTNFAVTATGIGPLSYQWRLNETNILGATNATLALFNLQATNAGMYSVVVTNNAGSATSANAVLTVGTPAVLWNVDFGTTTTDKAGPAAVGQSTNDFWNAYPYAGGFNAGGGVVLLQTANTNATPVGINLPGAPGSWGNGSLDPMYQGYVYPTFNPSAATMTVTISSLPPGDYDFCLYSSESNFQLVSGATDYGTKTGFDDTATNPPLWQEGKQYVQFRNVAVTNSAQPVIITVNPGPSGYAIISGLQIVRYAPFLVTQPTNAIVAVGNPITLQTLGEAAAPLNYQWFFNGNPLANAGRVSGATNSTLVITNAQLSDAGNYFAVLSGSSGAITSQVAAVQVGLPPTFTQHPASQTNLVSIMVQFSGVAPTATPFSYQWYFNGNPIGDGGRYSVVTTTNLTTLTIVSLLLGDAGAYSLTATNPFGSATSSIASLTVLLPPAITTPPQSQSAAFGSNISFQVVATGSAPLSYQWFFNSTPLADDARHSGATTPQLSVSNLQVSDTGDYTVVVGNLAGSITSVVATLTLGTPPSITQQPQPQTVLIGAPAQFSVTATSDTPFGYQWYRNGAAVSGATSNTLTFNPAQPFQAGDYTVVVSNAFSAITSSTAALTVISTPMKLL